MSFFKKSRSHMLSPSCARKVPNAFVPRPTIAIRLLRIINIVLSLQDLEKKFVNEVTYSTSAVSPASYSGVTPMNFVSYASSYVPGGGLL
jgi:hypothetical protein